MEIHIQLAGVQLGPYSEKQVRDSLAEGHLLPTDPARYEGTEAWETVSDVLAQMASAAFAAPKTPEKPVPTVATPQPSIARTTSAMPPIEFHKPPSVTTSSLSRLNPASKDTVRVPMPQLVKSLARQTTQGVKAALPTETGPPPTPSAVTQAAASGKSSEMARTSLLTAVKILAKKADQDTRRLSAAPASDTKSVRPPTVPVTFPKSTESTRTIPMSMGRLIVPKPDPAEKPVLSEPVSAKPIVSNPEGSPSASSKLADPNRTSLLSAPKALAKKADQDDKPILGIEAPQAPKSPSGSIMASKSSQALRTMPMATVKTLPQKADTKTGSRSIPAPPASSASGKSKESDLPAPEAVRFVAGETSLASETATKAQPASLDAVFSTKSLKRTTSLPSLVKALNKEPTEVGAKKGIPRGLTRLEPDPDEEPVPDNFVAEKAPIRQGSMLASFIKSFAGIFGRSKPDVAVLPEVLETPEAAEKKPEIVEKKPEVTDTQSEPADTKSIFDSSIEETAPLTSEIEPLVPRKKFKSMPAWAIYVVGGLVVLAGGAALTFFYIRASHQSADLLLKALKDGDQDQLAKSIDFPSVRETLKDEVARLMAKSGNLYVGSQAAELAMNKNSIDYYVTPQAISLLTSKPGQLPPASSDSTITPAWASAVLQKLNDLPVKSQKLVSYDLFVIDLDAAKLDLKFDGSSWKLNRIELNSDFQMSQVPGAPAAPQNLASSLVDPVIETYLAQGQSDFQKEDWDGAIVAFTQVLAMDPKQTVAYSNRGMARTEKHDFAGAIADFTQAISLDPKMAEAYYNRGVAKSIQNDIDGAVADFSQAISLDLKMAGAYYKRGTIRAQRGDYAGASADFTQDIALDPNDASAYSNRGYVRLAQKDMDGAITDFTQALAINPKIAEAYYNRAQAKEGKADLDGAILDYNRALDIDPKMTRAYYSRGIAKSTRNDLDGAIADYNHALALDPALVPALTSRALARQAQGDLKGALDDFNKDLALDPKIADAYYGRGLIKEQQNDFDGAIADSSRALDLDPKRAQAYYNRGFSELVKGNLSAAHSDLQKFCEQASRDPYADHSRLYLWLITMAQNPIGTANQDLSDALQNNWSLTPDDLVTKIAQFLLDRMTEADLIAAAASTDAKKDQGQHCEIWYFAGMKRLLAGDKTTAIDYFQKCLATGQKDYCEYILAQAELQALVPTPAP